MNPHPTTPIDRGEALALMEPMRVSEGSRHRVPGKADGAMDAGAFP